MIGLIERLTDRVRSMLGAGRVTGINDAGPVQEAQVQVPGVGPFAGMPVAQPYGISGVPPAGCNAIYAGVGGLTANGVVVGFASVGRPAGKAPGETVLYNAAGITIDLATGGLTIDAAGLPVAIQNASQVQIQTTGGVTLSATGTIAFTGAAFTFNGQPVMTG